MQKMRWMKLSFPRPPRAGLACAIASSGEMLERPNVVESVPSLRKVSVRTLRYGRACELNDRPAESTSVRRLPKRRGTSWCRRAKGSCKRSPPPSRTASSPRLSGRNSAFSSLIRRAVGVARRQSRSEEACVSGIAGRRSAAQLPLEGGRRAGVW